MNKVERYALIRKVAMKVQGRNERKQKDLQYAKAIQRMDDRSSLGWGDSKDYLNAHYGEVVKANYEE